MSGKRAKPTPWRFLRAAPVLIVAVVVWVMVGLFLLLPGSGSDQAHDWSDNPVPSASEDEVPTDSSSSPADSPDSSTPGAQPSPRSTTSPEDGPTSKQAAAPDLELSGASPSGSASQGFRPTSDPTSPPNQHESRPGEDNPGKKKGHDKPHASHGHKP